MLSFLLTLRPPESPLFPYTTLFRSADRNEAGLAAADAVDRDQAVEAHAHQAIGRARRAAHRRGPAMVEAGGQHRRGDGVAGAGDRKSTRLNSSHVSISYAVLCLQKKNGEILRSDRATTSTSCATLDGGADLGTRRPICAPRQPRSPAPCRRGAATASVFDTRHPQ